MHPARPAETEPFALAGHTGVTEPALSSLPEFMDFVLFWKTVLVANKQAVWSFVGHFSGDALQVERSLDLKSLEQPSLVLSAWQSTFQLFGEEVRERLNRQARLLWDGQDIFLFKHRLLGCNHGPLFASFEGVVMVWVTWTVQMRLGSNRPGPLLWPQCFQAFRSFGVWCFFLAHGYQHVRAQWLLPLGFGFDGFPRKVW